MRSFVLHHRGADDPQAPDLAQLGDERLGHAVGDIFLRRVMGEVFEWQHRKRADLWLRSVTSPVEWRHVRDRHYHAERNQTGQNEPPTRPPPASQNASVPRTNPTAARD